MNGDRKPRLNWPPPYRPGQTPAGASQRFGTRGLTREMLAQGTPVFGQRPSGMQLTPAMQPKPLKTQPGVAAKSAGPSAQLVPKVPASHPLPSRLIKNGWDALLEGRGFSPAAKRATTFSTTSVAGVGTAELKPRPSEARNSIFHQPARGDHQATGEYKVLPPIRVSPRREQIRVLANGSPRPVGSVDMEPADSGRIYISNLSVDPPHRRHGVATQLLNAVLANARNRGFAGAVLEARPGAGSIPAPALASMYRRMGFRDIGHSKLGSPLMERPSGIVQAQPVFHARRLAGAPPLPMGGHGPKVYVSGIGQPATPAIQRRMFPASGGQTRLKLDHPTGQPGAFAASARIPRLNTKSTVLQMSEQEEEPPFDLAAFLEAEKKKGQGKKASGGQKSGVVSPPITTFGTSSTHVEKFHTSTKELTTKTGADRVFISARINDIQAPAAKAENAEIGNAMATPDLVDPNVTNTTEDGEVKVLTKALNEFSEYLDKPPNQKKALRFEVGLSGAWGACDGCKKRIQKFAQVWMEKAGSVMKKGVTATLRITYQYLNQAQYFDRPWGKILYGWSEDPGKGPFFHTLEAKVTGTAE
jgi:GNAT superfamily N-acetyltransferase